MVNMGRYVTVSTKVRREIVERARELGINISELLRRALEEEVKKRELEELEKKLNELRSFIDEIDIERVVRIIREMREER